MISSNTELMLIIHRWAVAKYLTTNSTARILSFVNSETKRPMQVTIYTWITNFPKQNACKYVNFICWNTFSVVNIWLLAQQCKVSFPPKPRWMDCKHCNAQLLPDCECLTSNNRSDSDLQFALSKACLNLGAKMIKHSAMETWPRIPLEIKNKTCSALFLEEYKK